MPKNVFKTTWLLYEKYSLVSTHKLVNLKFLLLNKSYSNTQSAHKIFNSKNLSMMNTDIDEM